MFRIVLIVVFLLTFSGCDTPTSLSDDPVLIEGPIKLSLQMNAEKFGKLEDIDADFTVTNISNEKVTFGFPSGCQFGFTIKNDREKILDSRNVYACTAALSQLELKPGESKTYSIRPEANLIDLRPGAYKFSVFLLEGYSPKVSRLFSID